jgi:hypothetical protein
MRTFAVLLALALGVLLTSSAYPDAACATSGCGLRPLKPLTPLGCQDLCAECECDSRGQNCHWRWVCC